MLVQDSSIARERDAARGMRREANGLPNCPTWMDWFDTMSMELCAALEKNDCQTHFNLTNDCSSMFFLLTKANRIEHLSTDISGYSDDALTERNVLDYYLHDC